MSFDDPRTLDGRSLLALLAATLAWSAMGLTPGAAVERNQADRLGPLLDRSGPAGLCYQRSYDREHLMRHPGQTIAAMTVLLKSAVPADAAGRSFTLLTEIALRREPDRRYGMATCWWEAGANVLDGRKRALPFLASDDATRCMASVDANSAEEAGELVLGHQGEALVLFNGFSQMRSGRSGARVMRDVAFGHEDRILRLGRVDPTACAGIERALAEPVRAQNR
ncbi:hypothetical protein [Methylobacterium sp. Leaf118]|uniref:hypothetical protein n=1 Tax=Methylobacterium sp. Leaf118 TaxID=2876562 RepID=UPI001E5A1D09|nr:hypothetical protein [Methylobacterium sp. Leaf118]